MTGFTLDQSLGFVVNRAALRLQNALGRLLRRHGLTPQQWAVLNRLWEEDGLSQQQLSERTFKDPPNTGRILDKLERAGFVARRPDPNDRRVQQVFLTDKGRDIRPVLVPLAEQVLAQATRGISADDQATVASILRRIEANLD